MEFVIVKFPKDRRVFVDGSKLGTTGVLLIMEKGTHTFDLGAPLDYAPSEQKVRVLRTSRAGPLIVEFAPIAVEAESDVDVVDDEASDLVDATSSTRKTAKRVGAKSTSVARPKKPSKKVATKSVKKSTKKTAKKVAGRTAKKATRKAAKKVEKKAAKKSRR